MNKKILTLFFSVLIFLMGYSQSTTATFIGTDKTTQGFWEGKYGGDGYMLFGYGANAVSANYEHKITDIAVMPSYLADYNFGWGGGYWLWLDVQNDNPSILNKPAVLPPGVNGDKRNITASRADGTFLTEYTITFNDDLPHVFSYFSNITNSAGPTMKVELFDLNGNSLSNRQIEASNFEVGGYVSFVVTGSFNIKLQTQPGFGAQGFFFDALTPDVASALSAVYNADNNQIQLSWNNTGNADRILIERSTDNLNFDQVAEIGANESTYTDASINTGQQYYYRIRYRTGSRYGIPTASVAIETPEFIQTSLSAVIPNIQSVLNGSATISALLQRIDNGVSIPLSGKTIYFTLQGTNVGNGGIGQEIPANMGTAVTNANGIASLNYSTVYAGSFTVLASFPADAAEMLESSNVSMQINVNSPWVAIPSLIKISDAVTKGGLFTVHGAGFNTENIIVQIAPDLQGDYPATPSRSAKPVEIVQVDNNGNFVVARMPKLALSSVYNVWVKNKSGWSRPIKMNMARPLFLSEYQAAAGNEIEIVGRNFDQKEFGGVTKTRVRLTDNRGRQFNLQLKTITSYNIAALINRNTPRGTYYVEVSNDLGINWNRLLNGQLLTIIGEGADPLKLGVAWAGDFKWSNRFDVRNFGAIANDGLDDTQAIQTAVDAAEQAGGGVVGFRKGNYHLRGIQIGAGVVLLGEGQDETRLYYTGTSNQNFINSKGLQSTGGIAQLQGVARLSLLLSDPDERPDAFMWLGEQWGQGGNNNFGDKSFRTSNRIFVYDVKVDYPVSNKGRDGTGRGIGLEYIAKERVLVNNNFFRGWHANVYITAVNEYVNIRNNYFEFSIGQVHTMTSYSFFVNNKLVIHPESNQDSHGLFARANAYMAYNDVSGAGAGDNSSNDGEALSTEGPGGTFNFGNILQATSNTITVSPVTQLNENYSLEYGYLSVFIMNGRGLGQLRKVVSINPQTRVITIDKPFDIIPDSAGVFSLVTPLENFTVYKNKVSDCAKGIWPFGLQHDCVIADNVSDNTQGIFQFAARNDEQRSYYANSFTRITRNKVNGVSRKDNFGGIAVYSGRFGRPSFTGVQNYAVEILDNKITGNRSLPTGSSGTEAPPYSGISSVAFGFSTQSDGIVTGDNTSLIIDGNKLSELKSGITLTKGDYANIVTNNTYDCSVGVFIDDRDSDTTLVFNNHNEGLRPYRFLKPENNARVAYVDGRLEIKSEAVACVGSLTKMIYVRGPGLDTLIISDGMTEQVYLDSALFELDKWYLISGKLTDGIDTIDARNVVRFQTPQAGPPGKFRLYPNPARNVVYLEVPASLAGPWNIQLISFDGKVLLNSTRQLNQGVLSIDLSKYRSGLYLVSISNRTQRNVFKLIIDKGLQLKY